jgi:hypothetical protein
MSLIKEIVQVYSLEYTQVAEGVPDATAAFCLLPAVFLVAT